MAGVLENRVEQPFPPAFVGQELVAGDDLGLGQHPEELGKQHRQGRNRDTQQG